MKSSDAFPTNYAANVVACKLWGLTGSPTESILTLALFNKLCHFYDGWRCWVYSEHEYRQALAEQRINGGSFVLVPQWSVNQVGLVDLAVFIPGLDHRRPIVVVECDGHQFHERTPEQASKDRRRIRILHRLGIPVYPFTGTDVVRSSEESAHEIVEFIDARANGMERRWLLDRGIDPEDANSVSFAVPYRWPRTRVGSPGFWPSRIITSRKPWATGRMRSDSVRIDRGMLIRTRRMFRPMRRNNQYSLLRRSVISCSCLARASLAALRRPSGHLQSPEAEAHNLTGPVGAPAPAAWRYWPQSAAPHLC
jgi:very-short-patch-repair endonuclease